MAAEAIEETAKRRRAQARETLTPSISRDSKMGWSEVERKLEMRSGDLKQR